MSEHEGPRSTGFDTLTLHAGQQPDPVTGARATPIYQSASFVFPDSDFAVGLFNIERAGHVYSRLSNPTNAVLEERVSALEGGVGAIATASGQAAMHLAVATLCSAGDHIVASRSLYGGTHNLLEYTLPRFGIETTFVDPRSIEAFRSAITPSTKLLFGEILGNPGLEVLDLSALAEVAHDATIPLLVDSTFATPYLCKPIEHGADIALLFEDDTLVDGDRCAPLLLDHDGVAYHPRHSDGALDSVTIEQIELGLEAAGIPVRPARLTLGMILRASEMVVCGSGMGIRAIGNIDGRTIGKPRGRLFQATSQAWLTRLDVGWITAKDI